MQPRARTMQAASAAKADNLPARHPPEVGAVCLNRARTDLCGGREVTHVPTAILLQRERQTGVADPGYATPSPPAGPRSCCSRMPIHDNARKLFPSISNG